MFHDGIGEGERIEEEDENRKRIVKPSRRFVTEQVCRDAFENDGKEADGGSPEHDARFTASVDRGFLAQRIQKKRNDGEKRKASRRL